MINNLAIKQRRDVTAILSQLPWLLVVLGVLGLTASIPAGATSPDCNDEVKAFLTTPNEQTLKAVTGIDDQKCWNVMAPSEENSGSIKYPTNFGNLLHAVELGNFWAAQYLAEILGMRTKELDGGFNYEDALIALGLFSQFSDHGMEQLLRFRKDEWISEDQLESAMVMTPVELLADDLRGQLGSLTARRKRVMRITQESLATEKAVALKAIDDSASDMMRVVREYLARETNDSESKIKFGCDDRVKVFLSTPNKQTLKALAGTDDRKCWHIIVSSEDNYANYDNLMRSVELGNRWAAQYLAVHLKEPSSDIYIEGFLRVLGQFSNHEMEQFLRFRKDGLLSEDQFERAVTALPLPLSDYFPHGEPELNILKARKKRVMRITRDDLVEEQAAALKAIDDFASKIKSSNPQADDRSDLVK